MNPFRPAGRGEARAAIRAEAPTTRTDGTVATLRLYDPIDSWGEWWGISAKEFTRELDQLPEGITEIRLLINSPGGEVMEGIAIMNALRAHEARIVAVVEGIAASSASFIAAAADELVMMRNSELYIHNAWDIVVGDAADLRAVADDLENHFDRNIASVYAAKSGDPVEHWLAEMDKDRFLTAEEAVAEGLADRIEGEGDATAAKAKFDLSVFARSDGRRAAARASATQTPVSTEPGSTIRKETVMAYDDLKAGFAQRLGVTVAEVTDELLFAALDEALAEQPEPEATAQAATPAAAALPEGFIAVDKTVWEQTQANARQGAEARAQQDKERRDGIVKDALRDGQISAASAVAIRAQLDSDEARTVAFLATVPKNTVPVEEIGKSDALSTGSAALAEKAGWNKKGA
jgi:ATP-dependent Clp endopeptidase proteolytic subunit ClpP